LLQTPAVKENLIREQNWLLFSSLSECSLLNFYEDTRNKEFCSPYWGVVDNNALDGKKNIMASVSDLDDNFLQLCNTQASKGTDIEKG
jgi:hypothetical protein